MTDDFMESESQNGLMELNDDEIQYDPDSFAAFDPNVYTGDDIASDNDPKLQKTQEKEE